MSDDRQLRFAVVYRLSVSCLSLVEQCLSSVSSLTHYQDNAILVSIQTVPLHLDDSFCTNLPSP